MRIAAPTVLLAALFSAASAASDEDFFNEPEAGSLLDLSSNITIAWDQPTPPEDRDDFRYLTLEMRFEMANPNSTQGLASWTERLNSNLPLSRGGEFEWDPTQVREFLEEHYNNETGARSKPVVTFHAAMRGPEDGLFVQMDSEEFGIEGFGGDESLARTVVPAWLLVAAGVFFAL